MVFKGVKSVEVIGWKYPNNLVKLNMNGVCKDLNREGCGGVIRDNIGDCICGFV